MITFLMLTGNVSQDLKNQESDQYEHATEHDHIPKNKYRRKSY